MTFPNSSHAGLAIQDDSVRNIWAGWLIFIIFTSLIGDMIVLVSSVKYKAIKLHGVIVAFIQHIAVTDMLISVTWLIPCAASLTANRWVFGPALCYVRPYLSSFGYQASSFLVCGLTTSKLLVLKYPLRSMSWTADQAHWACALSWILALYWPLSYFTVRKRDVTFDYIPYTCDFEFSSRYDIWKYLHPAGVVLLNVVPNLVIVVTAGMILAVARRVAKEARQGLRWQGVVTVALTAVVYSISFLPIAVYDICLRFVETEPSKPGPFRITYNRIATSFLSFNITANFFIYSLTVSSFRSFLRVRFHRVTSRLFSNSSSEATLLLS